MQEKLEPRKQSVVFAIGDKVTWTHCTSNGSRLGFRTREGTIAQLGKAVAFVKMRNGRKEWIRLENLTPAGQTTELTKMFTEGMTDPKPEIKNP